jgi:hypothetical protein
MAAIGADNGAPVGVLVDPPRTAWLDPCFADSAERGRDQIDVM